MAEPLKECQLRVPPVPGLGIQLEIYDMVNVNSVVIGDHGFDVTWPLYQSPCLQSPPAHCIFGWRTFPMFWVLL